MVKQPGTQNAWIKDEFVVRNDDAVPAVAEPTGIEKMIGDALGDIKGFCDSVRADMAALGGRMDAMEMPKPAMADAGPPDEADVSGVAVETPTEAGSAAPEPATELADVPAPAAERIDPIDAVGATPLAADAGDDEWTAPMNDSVARASIASLKADIARLTAKLPGELTIEQRQAFATAQEQAESVFQSFGDSAPAPMQGESIGTYKRRLAGKMQAHSEKWKGTKLTDITDNATLDVIIGDIYNDAVAVARRGADVAPNTLARTTRRTPAGHTIHEYRGSPGAWMKPMSAVPRKATGKFNIGR